MKNLILFSLIFIPLTCSSLNISDKKITITAYYINSGAWHACCGDFIAHGNRAIMAVLEPKKYNNILLDIMTDKTIYESLKKKRKYSLIINKNIFNDYIDKKNAFLYSKDIKFHLLE